MSNILTKADIQAYAPELDLSAYSDPTISGMISMAQKRAEQFCAVDGFDMQAVSNEMNDAYISNEGVLTISVKRRPIVTVSSISLVKGGFSTSLNLNDTGGQPLYQIPGPKNKLVFPNSYFYLTGTYLAGGSSQLYTLRGAKVFYNMTYVGGWATPPDDLKYAIILYFRDSYSNKAISPSTGAPLSSFTQGSYTESYDTKARANAKSDYILQAEATLMNGGYKRVEF